MAAALEREEISHLARLEDLAAAWRSLWRRDPDATPFQHPAWLIPWWRHLGDGALRSLALWNGGRLAGLLPLYGREDPDAHRWRLVGIATSDYLGGLFDPAHDGAVDAALAWIRDTLPPGGACECAQLPGGSALARAAVPAGLEETCHPGEPTWVVALDPGGPGAHDARLPSKLRHNLATARHRAEQVGAVALRTSCAADVHGLFDRLVSLHGAEWNGRGRTGVLCDARVLAAHRESLSGLHGDGAARLHALEVGGRAIAAVYTLRDTRPGRPHRVYSYLGGFDPSVASWSPGSLILHELMRDAAAQGAAGFDLLRGAEPYKSRWGARPQPTVTRVFRRAG